MRICFQTDPRCCLDLQLEHQRVLATVPAAAWKLRLWGLPFNSQESKLKILSAALRLLFSVWGWLGIFIQRSRRYKVLWKEMIPPRVIWLFTLSA